MEKFSTGRKIETTNRDRSKNCWTRRIKFELEETGWKNFFNPSDHV